MIIIDIEMPGKNGIQVIQEFIEFEKAQDEGGKKFFVCFLSSYE
jgi:YesN/AraC family two-component response regulator